MSNDNTPSSIDSAPEAGAGATTTTAVPSGPSEFLRHIPSSQSTALGADQTTPEQPLSTDPPQPTAGPAKPTVDAHGRTLNPRSCVTCRKRKVKCDKTHPCANCNRAHIECVFPSPGRAPRKVRKAGHGRETELLERLRRLEGVVKGMGAEVSSSEKENSSSQAGAASANAEDVSVVDSKEDPSGPNQTSGSAGGNGTATGWYEKNHNEKTQFVEEQQAGRFENRFGRLVVNQGKSRYINNSFWANLSNEVEDLKGILNQSSDEEEVEPPEATMNQMNATHHGWVFGLSSASVDMLALHPLPNQIKTYWDIYKDRVDPLVKVLHIPTVEPMVLGAASRLSNLPKGSEALLFAMYYGVATSLSAEECKTNLSEEKAILLSRYRFAVEQSLSRANCLTTEEVIVLQAFVIFLICLRRNHDARVIWSLTGLVVRIAQTIGIHRDGSHFGLKPFEIEMRRRLWWQVCILDTRASEDHGCDPTIIEQSFDTTMPLNINDTDISPESTTFPPERAGCTDMSFCLIRFEVSNTFRRINYIPPSPPRKCASFISGVSLQDKERWITECHQRLEEKYLKHCDMSVPIYWVTATVARLMMSKMWLMVYHPFQRQDGGASLSEETREKLFITSLENIEYALLLETEGRTMKWGWLFKTYMQWHALAFLLSSLCRRTTGDLVDRAWTAVDKTRDGRWGMQMTENTRAGHLWRPLKKLYRKAKEARQRGLREEALAKQRAMSTGQSQSQNWGDVQRPMFEQRSARNMASTSPTAPLNQAQLRRFTDGPLYGQVPLDKHELLKHELLRAANAVSPEDQIGTEAAGIQQQQQPPPQQQQQQKPLPQGNMDMGLMGQGMAPQAMNSAMAFSQPYMEAMQPQYSNPSQISPVGPVDSSALDYSNFPGISPEGNGHMPRRSASLDTNPNLDMSAGNGANDIDMANIMDTSGDLNWENWDQLVRQFGMDVDSSPNGNGGVAASWGGPDWNNIGSGMPNNEGGGAGAGVGNDGTVPPGGLRMGTASGMGMGEWF